MIGEMLKPLEGRPYLKTCGLSRFAAQVEDHGRCVYLGSFDDAITAGMAHDKYVVSHELKGPLNFPHIREMMRQEVAEEVTDQDVVHHRSYPQSAQGFSTLTMT